MARTTGNGDVVLQVEFDDKGVQSGIKKVEGGFSGLESRLKSLGKLVATVFGITALLRFGKASSQTSAQAGASIQRVIDIYGEATSVVGDFIDANAEALGMSKSSAVGYSAVYGNLFRMWADSATNAQLTTQYLNATAVVASKTGRTIQDVQERIRSGLLGNTEAIEDLGLFVNIKTIEITDAFKRIANGRSWEKLNAYEQSQVRTLAILEQATAKYGLTVQDSAILTSNRFTAALGDLKQTIGELLNRFIMPAVEWFTKLLRIVNTLFATFFKVNTSALQGKDSTQSQADAIGTSADNQKALTDETKATAKAQKGLLAGFDEIEVLSKETSEAGDADISTGGTSGGLSPIPEMPPPDTSPMEDFAQKTLAFLQPTIEAFNQFKERVMDLVAVAGEAIIWFWNNAIVPFGTFVVNEALPRFFDTLALAVDFIRLALEIAMPVFAWLWNNFLMPIATWTGGIILTVLEQLLETFTNLFMLFDGQVSMTEFFENLDGWDIIILAIAGAVLAVWSALILFNAIASAYAIVMGIVNIVTGAFGIIMAFITSPIFLVVAAIAAVIAIVLLLIKHWDKVSFTAKKCWDYIVNVFKSAAKWFDDTVLKPIQDFFEKAMQFIIDTFNNVVQGIKDGINFMIGFVEGFVNGFIKGINKIIDALNSISFDIPSWVPVIGGNSFGFNFSQIGEITLPRLATGTVVPPNKEFMAILGDNTSEHEIISPISTMEQAFERVIARMGSANGSTVILEVDGREFGRAVVEHGNGEQKRYGTSLVTGGAY